MSLKERLDHDLKDAMRARDEVRLRAIRSLMTALTDQEIALRQDGAAILDAQHEAHVVMKQAKQRKESIFQFEAAGREDLAQRERDELVILERYMPIQMSDSDIRSVVHEIIVSSGTRGMQDLGRVMGEVMSRVRGKAEGSRVQRVVREMLDRSVPA
jgi:uncharacterized protein